MPFVLRPIPFPKDAWHVVQANEKAKTAYASIHPFQLALRWEREMTSDSKVTKARIAAREGLSRARVTQIMNLLHLPKMTRDTLLNPPESLNIRVFTERRLRELLSQSTLAAQMDFWRKWLHELQIITQN